MTAANDYASSDVSQAQVGNCPDPSMHLFLRTFFNTPSKPFFAPPDQFAAERLAPIRQARFALAPINSSEVARDVSGASPQPGASIITSSISIQYTLNKQGSDARSEIPCSNGLQSLETAMTDQMRY
jgi:hypothetical protein